MLPPRHRKQAQRAMWRYMPRKILSERGKTVGLLILSLVLIAITTFAPGQLNRVRMTLFDTASPVLAALSAPLQTASRMVSHMAGLSDMASDLRHLREENTALRQWYDRAKQLEAENRSLRGLVNLAELPRVRYVTARVIGESASAFSQNIVVDAGAAQGIESDTAAMVGEGLVGRVMAVGHHTAQILLVTDANARIPVVIENSRHRGILAGDLTAQPQLLYLPEDAAVSVGERVLTSGHGGVFAPGLPVGIIVSAQAGTVRVRPFADLRRLDFVQIIDFNRSPSITPPPEKAGPADVNAAKKPAFHDAVLNGLRR